MNARTRRSRTSDDRSRAGGRSPSTPARQRELRRARREPSPDLEVVPTRAADATDPKTSAMYRARALLSAQASALDIQTRHNAQKVSCGPVHAQAHQPCYTNLVQLLHGGPARPTASPLVMPIKSEALRRAGGILTTPETKARPHRGCGNQAHIREVRLEEGQSPRT